MDEAVSFRDGIHDISNEQYHQSSAISRSNLALMDKSPYHFWYEVISGKAKKREATPAMNVGSAFHTLLLEPHKFKNEFAISQTIDRRTAKGKEEYAIFTQENQGKILLTVEQWMQVNQMVDQVKRHEIVDTLLDEALFEQSIFWTDKETGIQFKARPDIWASKMVVDVKTTNDASECAFQRSAVSYDYYLQSGMIYEGCKAIGRPFEMFVNLVCEKEEPYVPAVYMMDEVSLQYGIDKFSRLKRQLKECLDKDKWPSYPIRELSVPKYALYKE
jgi:exodeoxyribonuclease VIII